MRKRRRKPDARAKRKPGMWRVCDFARSRVRRQLLATEDVRLSAALAQERRLALRAPTALGCIGGYGTGGRAMLVRWMFAEGRVLRVASATVGLAVVYVDRIVRRERLRIGDVQAVAAACLHLARKICEVGGDGMSVVETEDCSMNADIEMYAIEQLEWHLALPTPHAFLVKLADKVWIAGNARPVAFSYLESLISCT